MAGRYVPELEAAVVVALCAPLVIGDEDAGERFAGDGVRDRTRNVVCRRLSRYWRLEIRRQQQTEKQFFLHDVDRLIGTVQK